jgi:putative phosphoesterase
VTKFERKILVVHDISNRDIDYRNYDIVICGHTHKPNIDKQNHTWIINPGECGGWLTGQSTIAIFDLISDTAKIHRL